MGRAPNKEQLLHRVAELEESEHYFRTLYMNLLDAVMLIDPEVGIFDCNPATVAMFRAQHREEICQLCPADLSAELQSGCIPSQALANQHIAETLERGESRFEWQARRRDGEEFPAAITLVPITVAARTALLCVARDITGVKQRELEVLRTQKELQAANHELQVTMEQLQLVASTDQLTSAWNRRFFNRVISTERARAARSGNPITLILIDIDHFKVINDRHGHIVGDQVLTEVAATLQESLRVTDYLIRWGGEEFAILAPELDEAQGMMLAERLREGVAERDFVNGIRATISAGVAQLCDDDILIKWVARADKALYCAKHNGRNRVVIGSIVTH